VNRRSFFGVAAFTPVSTVALGYAPASASRINPARISTVTGDPGEVTLGVLRSEGLWPRVTLDGIEHPYIETADAQAGYIVRAVTGPSGNLAVNPATNEIIREKLYGRVKIELISERPEHTNARRRGF
jgi:hypothetical protein